MTNDENLHPEDAMLLQWNSNYDDDAIGRAAKNTYLMTPLEWVNEAITRHTTKRRERKKDAKDPRRSEYSRALDRSQEISHDYFLRELQQLKRLLVPKV